MSGLTMKYFVLKPKGADPYAIASRCALWAYADAIAEENPELSRDLKGWRQKEHDLYIAETTGMDRAGRRGEG